MFDRICALSRALRDTPTSCKTGTTDYAGETGRMM